MADQIEPIGWAVVELMGHRQVAGHVSEVTRFGITMLRIDVPGLGAETAISQMYGPAAIYCVTPVSEEAVRRHLLSVYSLPDLVRAALPAPEKDPLAEEIPL
jgi:hypothetical protein